MSKAFVSRRLCVCVCLCQFAGVATREACAQLSGSFRTAPETFVTYEYHADGLHAVLLPLDVTVHFSGDDPTSMLTATIHKPIISVREDGMPIYPIGDYFPMEVTGTSTNGRDFYGNLLETQYLFHWRFEPAEHGELVWNGTVGWAGGRYEETTIADARLLPLSSALPGDYNRDGFVNAADYAVWRDTFGARGTDLAADGNGNDEVDAGDYDVWRAHFGQAAAGSSTSSDAIPEPTAWLLMVAGLVLMSAGATGRNRALRWRLRDLPSSFPSYFVSAASRASRARSTRACCSAIS